MGEATTQDGLRRLGEVLQGAWLDTTQLALDADRREASLRIAVPDHANARRLKRGWFSEEFFVPLLDCVLVVMEARDARLLHDQEIVWYAVAGIEHDPAANVIRLLTHFTTGVEIDVAALRVAWKPSEKTVLGAHLLIRRGLLAGSEDERLVVE